MAINGFKKAAEEKLVAEKTTAQPRRQPKTHKKAEPKAKPAKSATEPPKKKRDYANIKPHAYNETRNKTIAKERRLGKTLAEIAAQYDLTVGRVSQIILSEEGHR